MDPIPNLIGSETLPDTSPTTNPDLASNGAPKHADRRPIVPDCRYQNPGGPSDFRRNCWREVYREAAETYLVRAELARNSRLAVEVHCFATWLADRVAENETREGTPR